MKKPGVILLIGLLLGTAGFTGIYYLGTASCREMMREPRPELAWLRNEFKLTDAEFARISELHASYLPQCAARCQKIEEQNRKLEQLLRRGPAAAAEVNNVLIERGRMRAECEAEMMQHFLKVSKQMPAAQGKRYLEWVEAQTFLRGQGMEDRHHTGHAGHPE